MCLCPCKTSNTCVKHGEVNTMCCVLCPYQTSSSVLRASWFASGVDIAVSDLGKDAYANVMYVLDDLDRYMRDNRLDISKGTDEC